MPAVELSNTEKKANDLVALAYGNPNENERARAALIAIKKIKENNLIAIDLDSYNKWWEEELAKAASGAGGSNDKALLSQIKALQSQLDQEQATSSSLRNEMSQARAELDSCSQEVRGLRVRAKPDAAVQALEQNIQDLTKRLKAAQDLARVNKSLREVDLARLERQSQMPLTPYKPSATPGAAHLVFAGMIAGGVLAITGSVLFKKWSGTSK